MIINMTGGGGGGLKVKAYAELPAIGREYEIAIITNVAIKGIVLAAEQPIGSEGLVWISLSNGAVKQYISGAWENREAHVYQGGAWVQFSNAYLWIYNNGVLRDNLQFTKFYISGSPSVSYDANSLDVVCDASNETVYLVYPTIMDVSAFTKGVLKFKSKGSVSMSGSEEYMNAVRFQLNDQNDTQTTPIVMAAQQSLTSNTEYTMEIDIPSGNAAKAVYVQLLFSVPYGVSGTVNVEVTEVRFV